MNNPFKNKVFRRWFWSILIVIVVLLLLRVPTRLSVAVFNRNTDLPFGLLEKKTDFSEYECLGGFGCMAYSLEDDNGTLYYQVSRWPDMLFGSKQTTRIYCTDPDFTIYGVSVGDHASDAEEILKHHGFLKWKDEYRRFGLSIEFYLDKKSQTITEIRVFVESTSILPVIF